MNEHEATRIAAAMHELRPDWPASSIKTLVMKSMADKPRRDVCVALAWIACESNSHTPARVLESGPWWRAAGVEGSSTKRPEPTPDDRCSVCSLASDRCRQLWSDDHEFQPSHRRPEVENIAELVKQMKSEAACHQRPADPEKKPLPPDPRVEALRAAKAAGPEVETAEDEATEVEETNV
jgi:hypothetical protein